MRYFVLGVTLAVELGCASAFADSAPSEEPSIYVAPMVQYTLQGSDPQIKDNFGYQAGLGFNLPGAWAIEGNFSRGTFDVKGTDGTRRQDAYTVDVIKKFFPADIMERVLINPYVLLGGGELNDRSDYPGFGHSTFRTATVEGGLGVLTGIGRQDGSTRVQLRTEAKYRMEWANPSLYGVRDPSGLIIGVGLQLNFGAPDDRPAKIVTNEVVREVQVQAPPPPPPPPPPPLPAPPPPPTGDIILHGVTFANNSAQLVPEDEGVLDTTVKSLKPYPNLTIEVRGYADSKGSQAYNLNLTQRRAETVMKYLQAHGVTNRLTARGFGKENPIADNSTAEGRLANRRVELHITGGGGT